MRLLIFWILMLIPVFTMAQAEKDTLMNSMKKYCFVMLKKGPDRTQDSATAAKIQEGHMANIQKLANEKKLIMAGPFLDDGEWRGLFIFDMEDPEEVAKLVRLDPAVKAGRLAYEIHPWLSQKGTCLP